ncbi:hypothetical protein B0G81_5413 [Paraburkholderia sp. BL6665CI2N2]|uniref:hypothetical protein n=1 Tax=Paraburkholderia sp. BL6665CI2N2 TaxID=1938806 RepID=UPI0010658218|nr:hypothetical protein [Paraburkholderia sp. BL6665CI2N2]TDY24964.1 hypothetical protein B0G81_5413 [Paraburkholderia sp. BL6665CI2N2]
MWKTSIVAVLLGTSLLANAQQSASQSAPQSTPQRPAQQVVQWQLQVMRDGQQIDAFDGTTTVGQARTDTHHKMVQHSVGCKDQPAGSIDLARTLTVSPLQADASGVTMSIDAQETFEENAARQTDTGCKLPPQPRQVSASHPGLRLAPGQWATWTIVDKDPNLVYRVRASLADSATSAN